MAQTLGDLVLRMILDHRDYDLAIQLVSKSFQQFGSTITTVSTTINKGVSVALGGAVQTLNALSGAAEEAGTATSESLQEVPNAARQAGEALVEAGEAANKAAGIFRDASGRLRDASGKFLTDEEVLKRLANGANLAEGDLKALQERANKISFDAAKKSADSLVGRLSSLGNTIQQYVNVALMAMGAALAAVGAASVYTGVQFEQKMDQVATVSGATAQEMVSLTEKARDLGATTAFSATEAADAMVLLAGAGMSTNQVLASTGAALNLAGAGGTSLDQAAGTLASTLAQFNISAEDSSRVVDVLAKATAASQFTVEDLSEALKYGGVVGAGFGWSLEETTAALAQFRDLGMQGSQAGTALRSAMIGATNASSTNVAVLEKYGLTLADINPETHSFAEILTTVGKAGVTTTDALVVFGAEAGAAIASLGKEFASGGEAYQDMLTSLEDSTGAAAAMMSQMQTNVAGAYANLQSAAEEVMLTLYDQYAGPLTALLGAVTEVVNKVAAAIVTRSALIKYSIADSLGALTNWVQENGDYFANMIGDLIRKVADFTRNIGMVLPVLEAILPLVDEIALTMALIWVVQQVAAFAAAVGEVVTLLKAGVMGVRAFGLAMVEVTGGMYAIVAAIGVLVVGLGTLIKRYLDAEDAANKLKVAQDKLKQEEVAATEGRVVALEGWLNLNKAMMQQEAQQLAASGERNSARYQELQTLLKLTGATAAQMEAEGKLVWVRGQLRTVGSLAEGMDPEDVSAFNAQVSKLATDATTAAKQATALEAALGRALAVNTDAYGSDALIREILREANVGVSTVAEAQAKLDQLRQVQKQAGQAARALQGGYQEATDNMLAQAEQGVQAEVGAVQTGTAEKIKLQQEYSDSTVSLHENLTRELQGIGASEEEQEKLRLEARQDDVSAQYEQQIDAARKYYQSLITDAKGNTAEQARLQAEFEAEKTRLEQAAQQDRDLVAQIAVKERAQQELEEAKKAADAKAKEEERIYGIINDLEEKDLSDSEQLQLEKARVLAGIDDEYGSEKARIAAAYDAQITKAEEKEEQDRRDARRDSLKSWIDDWQSAVGMVKQVIGSMKGAFDEVMSTATGFVDFFASGLETLTGFSFNLSDAISEAQGNLAEIQEGTAGMGGFSLSMADVGSVSDDLVAGMVDAAEAFVMTAIDAVPALMAALVERLPDLISTLVEAIPEVVAALAAAIPGLVQMFVTEAPKVIEALVQGMPLIVQGLVDGLPQIVDMLIGLLQSDLLQTVLDTVQMAMDALITELPRLIVALVEAIPGLFKDILAHLPSVISGLIAGIADIIVAIIDAIPEIVVGLIDALPGILIALIDGLVAAIPTIIVSILEAIPEVIGGVVGGIPEIFSAILSRIPSIITMLIGMIPDLILAFVQGLPDMLPAFISLFPDLIAALLTYMPEIVIAFLKALFVELPKEIWQMVPALGTAFKDAFVSAFDAIVETFKNIFQAAWESITSLFGGGEDKGGAYSGIDYVPATMRMTLHPGEAVIPASRNPMNRGGRADMPLAGGRASVGAFAGGGSGSNPTIQILMNGRVVEEIMQEANQLGQATMLTQKTRKIAGVKAGFDRGPFQKYGG